MCFADAACLAGASTSWRRRGCPAGAWSTAERCPCRGPVCGSVPASVLALSLHVLVVRASVAAAHQSHVRSLPATSTGTQAVPRLPERAHGLLASSLPARPLWHPPYTLQVRLRSLFVAPALLAALLVSTPTWLIASEASGGSGCCRKMRRPGTSRFRPQALPAPPTDGKGGMRIRRRGTRHSRDANESLKSRHCRKPVPYLGRTYARE